jgi:metal-responsive CopG/Arc/MetJ family transcriptional regulator
MLDVPETERFGMWISKGLLDRLDTWRRSMPVVPPRSAAIRQILATFLEAEEKKAVKRGRK